MKSIIKVNTKIYNAVVALFCTFALTFNKTIVVKDYVSFLRVFEGDSVVSFILFLTIYYCLCKEKVQEFDRRTNLIVSFFSLLISNMYIVGSDISYTHHLFRGASGKYAILCFIILIIFSYISIFHFCLLMLTKFNKSTEICLDSDEVTFKKQEYIKLLIPFILIRLVFFFLFYPGSTTWDGMYIIKEGLGYTPLTNSHPYLYTYIVGLFAKLGWKFFGGVGVGVALLNLLTMIITSLITVYVLLEIFDRFKVNKKLKMVIYLFYLMYPNFIITSITTYKDTHLMNALMIYFLCIILIQYFPKEFWSKKKYTFAFVFSFFLVYMLHRKAVIYLIVAVLALLVYNRLNRKKVLLLTVISIVFTLGVNQIGLSLLKPAPSRFQYDYLSPRFQQLASAMKFHRESFTEEEIKFYDETLGLKNLDDFEFGIADPIKQKMKNEKFAGREKEFFEIWLKGYRLHPKTYIEAVLNLSVSYWSIYSVGDVAYIGNYYYSMYHGEENWFENDIQHDNNWNQNQGKNMLGKFNRFLDYLHWEFSNFSIFSIFYKSGIFTILLLLIWLISIIRKDKLIGPLILLIASVILTCVFSPVTNYFRYAYIYVMLVPLLLPLIFVNIEKKHSDINDNLQLQD